MALLYIALFLRIISNPIANACQKRLSENVSSLTVNFYISAVMAIGCVVPAFSVDWSGYGGEFWWNVLFAGLFCSLGTICLIKALYFGELSILGPLNAYKSVVGLISAFLLLGELPTNVAIGGVCLIVVGSLFLISPRRSENESKRLWLSISLRLLALVFTGCEASILKKIILMSSVEVSFILWCFSAFIFGGIFVFLLGRRFNPPRAYDWVKYLLAAICLGVMQYTTNIVFARMEVGSALALFQLSSIINLFLGYKIFNEGGMLRKLVGTIVMIIGAVMILL